MPAVPRVIVMGGSLGGLTAALVLRDAGCEVRIFERSSSALQARGAGIAGMHPHKAGMHPHKMAGTLPVSGGLAAAVQ